MKHKGEHIFLDITDFYIKDLKEGSEYIFNLMKKSIELTNIKIKHSKLIILDDNTPEGFTSVLLLDESHITCHSYTKLGLLAFDIFTCGDSSPKPITDFILKELKIKYPNIKCNNYNCNKRFIHN